MKNYEELYKTALERARANYDTVIQMDKDCTFAKEGIINTFHSIFPELKEISEDELMRKEAIAIVKQYNIICMREGDKCYTADKVIAWLEKQGEYHISHDDEIMIKQLTEYFTTGYGLQNNSETVVEWLNDVKEKLEKQCKKKPDERKGFVSIPFGAYDSELVNETIAIPDGCVAIIEGNKIHIKKEGKSALEAVNKEKVGNADKDEPKFKIGYWVVWDNKISCHIDNIYQGKESLMYAITDVHNMTRSYSVKGFDNNAHIWDIIKDAHDGDVLATGQVVFIFKTIHGVWLNCHCSAHKDGSFFAYSYDLLSDKYFGEVFPATKEQRDTLFANMKDAGYEWFADTKELVNIKAEQENLDKLRVVRLDELPMAGSGNQSNASNGVWHTADEAPVAPSDRQILVLFKDDNAMIALVEDYENLDNQVKWAYIKDLIK